MAWDPDRYLDFADLRLRPALELLDRVAAPAPDHVVDLGCGPGNVTAALRHRWPAARITAVDRSPEMLARARADHADLDVRWLEADAATWEPDGPIDVLFSNATLHWLDDHATLIPRLAGTLGPGGELAFQVPDNHDQPSHTCAYATARDPRWRDRLEPLLRERPIGDAATYYDLLAPTSRRVDIWATTYTQVLHGPDPVAAWTSGSVLRPLLDALEEDERPAFDATYRACVADAYPVRPDGVTLFDFRRLFVVAQRR